MENLVKVDEKGR